MSIKRLLFALVITLFMATALACGEDEDDTGNNGENAENAENSENNETSQVCSSSHECVNDVCECTTEGMEGDSCTDNEACEDECEVCVEE